MGPHIKVSLCPIVFLIINHDLHNEVCSGEDLKVSGISPVSWLTVGLYGDVADLPVQRMSCRPPVSACIRHDVDLPFKDLMSLLNVSGVLCFPAQQPCF